MSSQRLVDTIVAIVPPSLDPGADCDHTSTGVELTAFLATSGELIAADRRATLISQVWTVTHEVHELDTMPIPHDCPSCRTAMDNGREYLRQNPGRHVAVCRLVYRT